MTSKQLVLLFYPNALSLKVRSVGGSEDWRIVSGDDVIGRGWRAGSAWNNAGHRIRACFKDASEFVCAMGDLAEGKTGPADYAERLVVSE